MRRHGPRELSEEKQAWEEEMPVLSQIVSEPVDIAIGEFVRDTRFGALYLEGGHYTLVRGFHNDHPLKRGMLAPFGPRCPDCGEAWGEHRIGCTTLSAQLEAEYRSKEHRRRLIEEAKRAPASPENP